MIKLLQGHWVDVLNTLPDKSVHCCVTSPPYWGLRSYLPEGHPLKPLELGQEKTPDEYVAKLVAGFREVRRVLRDDGTLWVNLGDSYARQAGDDSLKDADSGMKTGRTGNAPALFKTGNNKPPPGLKPKDLVGIPWLTAFALRSDSWYLRSEITWCKKSCMPESVEDRPTNATEKIFLFAKSERYFYDSMAVRNPYSESTLPQVGQKYNGNGQKDYLEAGVQNPSDTKRRIIESLERNEGSNLRNFWLLGPEPYRGAHFATFPTEIPRRAILLGTSAKGCCPKCWAPWGRKTEVVGTQKMKWGTSGDDEVDVRLDAMSGGIRMPALRDGTVQIRRTLGWQPTCDCGCPDVAPCTVLDPFGGSGTTGEVAIELGRNAILIDLNPDCIELQEQRTSVTPGLLLC